MTKFSCCKRDIQKEVIEPLPIIINESHIMTESSEILTLGVRPPSPKEIPIKALQQDIPHSPSVDTAPVVERISVRDKKEITTENNILKQRPPVKKAFGENQSSIHQNHNLIDDSDNDSLPEVSSNSRARTSNGYQLEASHPFSIQL